MKRISPKYGWMLLALVFLLWTAGTALAGGGGFQLQRYVIGGGGGSSASGAYRMNGTMGQGIAYAGRSSESYGLCSGYWCGLTAEYQVYLPLVLRES